MRPVSKRALPIIRVFVSSTFSDLKHERNALHAQVWPELERYCQQRGFTFQAIDLRWGVPAEAGLRSRRLVSTRRERQAVRRQDNAWRVRPADSEDSSSRSGLRQGNGWP